jgi:hypothetical protein
MVEHVDLIGVSPDDAVRISGLKRTTLFNLLKSGQIRSVKVGHRRVISVASLRDLIDGGPDAAA